MELDFHPYIRLAMYHTWLPYYYIDRCIFDFELIFIDKGTMCIEINNKRNIVKEGDLILIPPNVHHKISWYKTNCCQPHVHFDFNKDELSSIIPVTLKNKEDMTDKELTYFRKNYLVEHGYNLPLLVHCSNPAFARTLILRIIDAYTFDDPMKNLNMEGALKMLIAMFISDAYGYKQETENFDTVSLLVRYMSENLQNNLSLRDFEMKSNLSSWALNELFNKTYNITPKKYYDKLRLNYAKNLLRNSFYSTKEISELMNFNEPQTFSRWFYKLDGRYPTQYKNEKKKKKNK